jgi:RNA polymerase sigma factor (sigma-70 family)
LYKAIRRLAMQIMPDRVDDLTQDVALSLWSKRSRLPAMVPLSYLRSTVRNASYDLLRRERRQKIWVDAIAINENGSISTMKEPQRQFYWLCKPLHNLYYVGCSLMSALLAS